MVKSTAKDKKWFIDLCEKGCQICGRKFPGQKNNGLEFSHIISNDESGNDKKENCLALCPNCAYAFDVVIKPSIYEAFAQFNNKFVPENWKNGEGRKSKSIDKDLPLQ